MLPKRVLITGGAQRLGALLCREFAHAGWEVWCHYQRSGDLAHALVEELRTAGFSAYAVQADLALQEQRLRMMEQIAAQGGPLTCLVNNASLFEEDAADALNLDLVRRQLEVNLLAPLSLSALMVKCLSADAGPGDCSIVHVLDQKVFNLNPDYFSYTVSKLALERSVALQAQALPAPYVSAAAYHSRQNRHARRVATLLEGGGLLAPAARKVVASCSCFGGRSAAAPNQAHSPTSVFTSPTTYLGRASVLASRAPARRC